MIDTEQIRSGMAEGLGELAGDKITYHYDGKSKELRCIKWDDMNQGAIGIEVDTNGIRNVKNLHVLFLTDWLDGVEIAPPGYFTDSQGRWDFLEDAPVWDHLNPIAGIQNLIYIRIRRSEEVNNASDGEFSIG